MPEPMLTVSLVQYACERARRSAMVGIAVNDDRSVTDFATWGKEAADKVYADGLGAVIRRGLGYTPVPPAEDFKLQAAGLKVMYDAIAKLKDDAEVGASTRRRLAILDEIWMHYRAVPTTFRPPAFNVFTAWGNESHPEAKHKMKLDASMCEVEQLMAIMTKLPAADRIALTKWVEHQPMPGDFWRDDLFHYVVVRAADL